MRFLAAILLIGVFVRHDSAKWLAGDHYSVAAVFYMLGGAWEVILCATVLLFTFAMHPSLWKSLIQAAMLIGIVEAVQMPVCRLLVTDIRSVPAGMSLCDHVTGLPIGIAVVSIYFLILIWSLGRALRAA